jgi:cytochrome c oxidase subunit 3/cytochrome o ubiquinol oxidase subunit 3
MSAIAEPVTRPWTPVRSRVGILSLIVAETAVFGIFVVAHLYYLGQSLTGPTTAVLSLPIMASIVLWSSSGTVELAVRSLRRGAHGAFSLFWGLTAALGIAFLGFTAAEWYRLIYVDGLTMQGNLLGTTFYSLVGLHASHVIVGTILLSTVFCFALAGRVTRAHEARVEAISYYWHFVDAVWVVVFVVVYVIGR